MRFPPVSLSLKDGRPCLIREATPEDGPALFELERAVAKAREGVVKLPEELPADITAFAARREAAGLHRQDGTAFPLVATGPRGALWGEASFLRPSYRMLRHGGVLWLIVHPEAQGLGVGRALLGHLLAWLRVHRDANGDRVHRVELQVRGDNPRAQSLYRSFGFVLEGIRRDFLRTEQGVWVDDLLMSLLLHPEQT
ncbi:GNAT family N-acetyltransferase [Myxococcus sp. K38C18041901]|uniref:GNAT family N-acetyltransferase n=1 Tax=Myxococcus guangdongensis TaxID=2906760 RepID=UPI0020A81645|nr:GNAT family N-acetyltransferase [Myxococcus guangdongensis]MCP3062356.1 GNAT family N-acetyltransferase [Myxococcus guangdongensis]